MRKIVIATRGSQLALWQANHIREALLSLEPDIEVDLSVIRTRGDKILDVPLSKVGGKGLFVKEIEEALLDCSADLAVHSIKDVPMVLPEKLTLGCIPRREVFTDCLVSEKYATLDDLPHGARVGTSSLRRQAQLLALRPDLEILSLRGNVDTRLRKMKEGEFDAIVLASAGMKRLGLSATYMHELDPAGFVPAVGQGALGIECRADDAKILSPSVPMRTFWTEWCAWTALWPNATDPRSSAGLSWDLPPKQRGLAGTLPRTSSRRALATSLPACTPNTRTRGSFSYRTSGHSASFHFLQTFISWAHLLLFPHRACTRPTILLSSLWTTAHSSS